MRTIALLFIFIGNTVIAQNSTNWQVWNNIEVGSNVSNQLYLCIDGRYRTAMGSDVDRWHKSGILARSVFTIDKVWMLHFDLINYYTDQQEAENTYEFSQRLGATIFIFKNGNSIFSRKNDKEYQVTPRIELTNLNRFEHRMFRYSDTNTTNSYWRWRNRTRIKYALNRENMMETRLWKLEADLEFFIPLSSEPSERYLSNMRFRIGSEYKHSQRWRYRAFYSFDHSGNGISKTGAIDSHMLMLRIKHVF